MSPAWSWLLFASVCAWGVWFAIWLAHRFEDNEWRQWQADLDEWRAACDALEVENPYDWDDQPHDVADKQPHRGE